ncbi:hypothetical protein L1049_008690 [Liquidambar formosana]|uniref:Uncharacterized protein n=1 Tax=Liquidambar formosana TaxID=63359 RepID=A0AAP0S3Z9_LIQFO
MSSLFLHSPLLLSSRFSKYPPRHQLQPHYFCSYHHCHHGHCHSSLSVSCSFISHHLLCSRRSFIGATTPSNEGAVSVINFEDFMEKDWSFLEFEGTNSEEERNRKTNRIVSAGEIGETSRVLVSIGSEYFVDRLVDTSPCHLLLVVHDSLFLLAGIKEKYDKVKCWQGELIHVPEKWAPFDVAFLYFLPALPFKLDQVLEALAKHCLPGARLVISHPQGREVIEQQRQQYPDVVVSDLPDKLTLQKVAADHSFKMAEFVDEPGFYLAVLKFCEARNSGE